MMLTTEEQREEAERLVGLGERGRLIEAVALTLQIGEQQEEALRGLVELDRTFIEDVENGRLGRSGVPDESEGEIPPV